MNAFSFYLSTSMCFIFYNRDLFPLNVLKAFFFKDLIESFNSMKQIGAMTMRWGRVAKIVSDSLTRASGVC